MHEQPSDISNMGAISEVTIITMKNLPCESLDVINTVITVFYKAKRQNFKVICFDS